MLSSCKIPFIYDIISWVFLFCFTIVSMTKSCKQFRGYNDVNFNISDCFSYEMYTTPRPPDMCVRKCSSNPGCIAVGTDSMDITSTCCILVESDITLSNGNSTIIHLLDTSVCVGSDWSGVDDFNDVNDTQTNTTFEFQFDGLGENCSHFKGMPLDLRPAHVFGCVSVHASNLNQNGFKPVYTKFF